jgi:hypothetical protein
MKTARRLLSPAYRSAVLDATIVQAPILFLSGLAADGGAAAWICMKAALVFWAAVVLIAIRRPQSPSKWDLRFIRFGFLLLLPICGYAEYHAEPWWNHFR